MSRSAHAQQAATFRGLHHAADLLVLPNAWDAASARLFEAAGFPAIATTSSGIAFAHGVPDGQRIGRDEMLAVVRRIAGTVAVPVTADLEAGYGPAPADVADTVRLAIEAGAVGCNLEDNTGDRADPLVPMTAAVERIAAARHAADATGIPLVINARTDAFLWGAGPAGAPFGETVRRGNAYLQAGADCVFVPGVHEPELIEKLLDALDGPLNILVGPGAPPLADLQALGVARVSIGGSVMRACLGLVQRTAAELRGPGTYTYAEGAPTHPEVNRLFTRRQP